MNSFALKNTKFNQLKGFVIVHSGKRAKTQRCQLSQQNQNEVTKQNTLKVFPLIDKPSDFPTIFSRHKRIEYSGYKQCNLNKSKYISFEQQSRKHHYQPMRQYEANLKNISKLRKRYSLEPRYQKNPQKKEKDMYQTSFFKTKDQSQIDFTNSEQKHHQNLRQIMQKFLDRSKITKRQTMKGKRIKSCFKIENEKDSSMNIACLQQQFHRYEENNRQAQIANKTTQEKNATQFKPLKFTHIKNKPKMFQKLYIKDQARSTKPINIQGRLQVEQQLCGWQNRTFFY